MATRRVSILNGLVKPDDSGEIWQEPATIKFTTAPWENLIWIFDDVTTGTNWLYGCCSVPKGYNTGGTTKIIVVWSSTGVYPSNDVDWDFSYRAVGGDDTESLNQSGEQEALSLVTDNCPSAAGERMEASFTLTASNLAADDTLQWSLGRVAADALASWCAMWDVLLEYDET